MNSLRIFRIVSLAEGVSLLVLLFIAMPLKYFLGMPEAVKMVGWIHGVLFITYVVALLVVEIKHKWPFLFFVGAFVASLIPFGTFVLDKQIKKREPQAL